LHDDRRHAISAAQAVNTFALKKSEKTDSDSQDADE